MSVCIPAASTHCVLQRVSACIPAASMHCSVCAASCERVHTRCLHAPLQCAAACERAWMPAASTHESVLQRVSVCTPAAYTHCSMLQRASARISAASTHRSVLQRVYTWLHTLKCGCTCNRTERFQLLSYAQRSFTVLKDWRVRHTQDVDSGALWALTHVGAPQSAETATPPTPP
jgi:hypothetical protein